MSNFIQIRAYKDGAHNPGQWRDMDLGETGNFLPQVVARRWGMFRHGVWEICDTSAYPNVILSAEIEAE